jgi:hypothetical protein
VGWLDVAVGAAAMGFGVFLAIVLLGDGGTAVEVALVLFFFAGVALHWMRTSFGWKTVRDWRVRRRRDSTS